MMKKLLFIGLIIFIFGCGNDIDETTITRSITISGEVYNSSLQPLEDVDVTLFIGQSAKQSIKSDKSGQFEFLVDESDFNQQIIVQGAKQDYAKSAKSVNEYSDNLALVSLVMHKTTEPQECNGDSRVSDLISVSGYIVDQDGNPSKGEVTLVSQNDVQLIAYTDKQGKFLLFVSNSTRIEVKKASMRDVGKIYC